MEASRRSRKGAGGCLAVATPTRRLGLRRTLATLALVTLPALAAYHNSFSGPFIFDDIRSIVDNPRLHHLATALPESPENGGTLVGRPVVRVSLWLNHAWGGKEVGGYHGLNLLLHVLSAWTLGVLARRLLESPRLGARYGEQSFGLALAIALLWTVHPLQTESVTYVVQRSEILGGLFYLLTLYGVVRSITAGGRRRKLWSAASLIFCVLGLASKETVATAPLAALAMDRVFFAPSWRRLWRERGGLYAALACSWVLLAMLMAASHQRMGSAGFGLGMRPWDYARTQPYYLCRYLLLSAWPSALTFDYGAYVARTVGEVVPYAAVVLLLLALTLLALWREPALGFCGLWFFLVLGPTSSFVPLVTQTGAEHRMYLPLVGVMGLAVVGGYTLWRRVGALPPVQRAGPALILGLAVLALAARTVARNEDYRSDLSIWRSAVENWPANPRAHNNLGNALANAGRLREAIAQDEEALRLEPDFPEAHNNLGLALASGGRFTEAIAQYKEALRLKPDFSQAYNNLGIALEGEGRLPEAIAQYEQTVRLRPDSADAHYNLANALVKAGQILEAESQFQEALTLDPALADAYENLAWLYATHPDASYRNGSEAVRLAQEAVRLKGNHASCLDTLAAAYAEAGRFSEAIGAAERALVLARAEAETSLADQIEARLGRYRAGQSFHEGSP
jgi:tetratricopeptide (TPR) repeat protein